MDKLIHGTAASGTIRVIAADTTLTTAEAVRRHGTSPTVSAALGRMLTGTLLLGATLKDFDRLTAKIDASGPIGGVTAEATNKGTVRGYVKNPLAEVASKQNGKFDVSGIIGGGTFYVIRESGFDIGLHRDPYVGSVPIVSGEIAEDFAYYLAKSEQIPSAVLLGVLLQNSEPYVKASGGLMIQMMPGVNEHHVTMIEDTISRLPSLTEMMAEGMAPDEIAERALGDFEIEIMEHREVAFACNCSVEKAFRMIEALGLDEVEAMLREDRGAKMTCGFCNETYVLSENDLARILRNDF